LEGAEAADRALASLHWALTALETPQPVALDLRGITAISEDFLDGFFVKLLAQRPESFFGPHQVLAVGASPPVARELRSTLGRQHLSMPILIDSTA